MKNNKLVAIDLFCGCGGFSYGFQQAGFDMALGIDMWKDATVTYKHNFPNACVINELIQICCHTGMYQRKPMQECNSS
jgi:DNA (cytosine-5)-methyltransferase 1